ncbi:MAG TPA: sigma-70 family RNA polymerase sigma factor [Euzebyales bacterium]|nr:sigma-70 family RNA polymerase sigma factor [Euzebyales bacterium]
MSRDPDSFELGGPAAPHAAEPSAQHRGRVARAGVEWTTTGTTPDAAITDLLVRVAGGDEAAFGTLYDMVSARVFGLALRITRNRTLAEDVTQEVMVEVWRIAPRFDALRGSGIGWILMLAHRRAVDRVRRTTSERAREVRDGLLQPVQEPIDEDLLRDDERREVSAALEELTALQREAIRLAYYEGHTYREVAELLDIPEGTAKSRLRDGIRQLRASLRRNA